MIDTTITRGIGTTTSQMMGSPKGSLYVWCTTDLAYARKLAKHIGRADLVITHPGEFERHRGRDLPCIMLDHATQLDAHQRELYGRLMARAGRA